jgi:hypothetical protein
MPSTLLDAFDRPITVRVRGLDVRVGALTLGALADLQAWVRDHSWDPWDVPDPGDLATAMALVVVHADGWPPPVGSTLASLATAAEGYQAELAYVAFGRSNGLSREDAALVGEAAREDVLPWQRILGAAYGERPDLAADRILNGLDGAAPGPDGDGPDWALSIATLVIGDEGRRGMSFAEAEALTLPQHRLLCRAHRDEKGRLRLAAGETPRERPRPGEHWKVAKARRAALLGRATAILEAHYSGAASVNGAASTNETGIIPDRPA